MNLDDLGLSVELKAFIIENIPGLPQIGRVIREHRERYAVSDGENEYDAEITGNMRYSAASRAEFSCCGRLGDHYSLRH